MTFDRQDPTSSSDTVTNPKGPLVNNHYLLPLSGKQYAPKTLHSNAKHHHLAHFLEAYERLCRHHGITDESEKCQGFLDYCSSKVVEMIKRFPSFIQGNYARVVKDLYYFLKEEDNSYSITSVGEFTKKWRERKIESITKFKRYYRKYLECQDSQISKPETPYFPKPPRPYLSLFFAILRDLSRFFAIPRYKDHESHEPSRPTLFIHFVLLTSFLLSPSRLSGRRRRQTSG